MIVAVIVIAVAAVCLLIGWSVTARRLGRERAERLAVEAQAAARAADLEAEVAAAEAARTTSVEEAEAAADEARAAVADAARNEELARAAAERAERAERSAALADARSTEVFAGFDPQLVWALEQSRSERLWRLSIALGPDLDSVFEGEPDPLRVALQVEVDAAREEVGSVVNLDAELPASITPAGSVLVLRSAQELLASVVRRSEDTTVRVRPDGRDMLVTIESRDEHGEPVPVGPLATPPSASFEVVDDGVRIHNVVVVDDDTADEAPAVSEEASTDDEAEAGQPPV